MPPILSFVGVAPDVKLILVVVPAGNTDPRLKKNEQKAYPASYPEVLSVGAVGPDGIANFSNTTSKVDVSAPGQDIISSGGNGYIGQLEGTSFAAPYVTGVAALIKSAHPELTSRQIKNRLLGTANGSLGSGSGSGIINPYQAVTAIGDFQATPAPPQQAVARRIDIGGPPPVDHRRGRSARWSRPARSARRCSWSSVAS